jgi:hypothetical protein
VFLSSVLAIVLAGIALAQTPAPISVRWQSDARNSDWVVRNGLEIVMLGQDGLTVKVALTGRDPRQVALVSVTNQTGQRIELLPSRMTLDLVEPKHKTFRYLDPDALAAKVRQVSPWVYIFGAMAMMGTQTSWTSGTVGGQRVNLRTTTHDQAAEDRALNNIEMEQERKAAEASNIQSEGLRENTLLPGESVAGAVFFAAPKGYEGDYEQRKLETVLTIPVGDYVFEFPFWWGLPPRRPKRFWRTPEVVDFPTLWKAKK